MAGEGAGRRDEGQKRVEMSLDAASMSACATLFRMRNGFLFVVIGTALPALAQTPNWSKVNEEALRHFQALVQIDSTDPPGNETRVVDYVKGVLEREGIPVVVAAKDPARANLIARLKGNGSRRPLLIMGLQTAPRNLPSPLPDA